MALLCGLLDVPTSCSYAEAEKLLWYAFLARGIEQNAVDRQLEREMNRFQQSPGGMLFWLLVREMLKKSAAGKVLYPLLRRIDRQRNDKYLRWARMMD